MKHMSRITSILLAAILLLSACAFAAAEQPGKSWLKDTSPIELELFMNYSWFGNDWTDPASARVTEETGVTVKINKPVADDNQKLTLMINSNSLPDYVLIDKNNPLYSTLIRSGQVADIGELADLYAPELKQNVDKEVFTNYLWEDGKTYSIVDFIEGEEYLKVAQEYNGLITSNQGVWAVRGDYYDEIGRPDMSTPESFTEALAQMSALHPDKIPFYVGDGGLSTSMTTIIGTKLSVPGIEFGVPSYVVGDDNSVKSRIYSQQFADTLMFLNDLATKDLFPRDSFIDTSEVAAAKCNSGDPIVYSWTIGDCQKIPADNPDTKYEILPPFETYMSTRTGAGWNALFIGKNSKNLERATTFVSYLASDDGHAALQYGNLAKEGEPYSGDIIAGPHYYMDGDKPTAFLDYYADKQKDWGGVEKANGLGCYWFACSGLKWNIHFWNKDDEFYAFYNDLYGDKIKYVPAFDNIDPDPASDEGVIISKLTTLFETSCVKIVFAKDKQAAMDELNAFIAKSEEIGLAQVEAVWTQNYRANLAKMGL